MCMARGTDSLQRPRGHYHTIVEVARICIIEIGYLLLGGHQQSTVGTIKRRGEKGETYFSSVFSHYIRKCMYTHPSRLAQQF